MTKPYETEQEQIAAGRKFYPLYPGMWKASGEKCLHVQRRGGGRIDLVCCRLKGHSDKLNPSMAYAPNHLHDVPPELQIQPKEVTA